MIEKTIVVQIQGIAKPVVARSVHSLLSCLAMLVPSEAWDMEVDEAEDWCNIQFKSRRPTALWQSIRALVSEEPSSLRALEACWIVVCEGRHAWDDYRTLEHFNRNKGEPALRV